MASTERRKLTLFRRHPPICDPPVIHPTPYKAEGPRLLASSSSAVFHNDAHVSTSAAVPVLSCNVALAGESQEAETRCVEKRKSGKAFVSDDDLAERTHRKPARVDGGCSKLAENPPVSHSV